MIPSREELTLLLDEADWGCLRAHLARGGLIFINSSLDLIDVAINITCDNTDIIEKWITDDKIGKPTEDQINSWDDDKQKLFAMLIVSPYVLIQERLSTPRL